eukprot:scaffold192130_cov20-Prasinocladus_malaysianus.AAC.1
MNCALSVAIEGILPYAQTKVDLHQSLRRGPLRTRQQRARAGQGPGTLTMPAASAFMQMRTREAGGRRVINPQIIHP